MTVHAFLFQHDDQRIYTASADGEIKVHEIREQSLNCVYVSENVRSPTGSSVSLRGVKSLVVKDDRLFCGDDGVNIKVLDWRKGRELSLNSVYIYKLSSLNGSSYLEV